ncbi:ABC transporter ATP-binding protein [Alteribacter natronophilus]|uniref:ABC transporter ATP-binding protein n=1 Tax=Alteribacter natronophilus TaxID=2583810 RepID=UPI00110DEA04|nr:ABC transporter ATP-binding protein [Alteribacter natronophilus]TMW71910.1 ABC transporter ATP-binding protein [Alteribacter natronophilus]
MTEAISGLNFTVSRGEFVSLIGPSGCGKTTLLSMVSGLLRPTAGKVLLDGSLVERPTPATGYMLQQDYLFPWLTIRKNILIGLHTTGAYTREKEQHALNLLKEIGIGDHIDEYPSQLSGGMRQRAALVRMLATEPKLLLLDEPFSALDYQTKLKLEDLVSKTIRMHRKTAVLVTHDIGEAIAMSDRIVMLSPRPASVHRIFRVPDELKGLLPFEARNHPAFSGLFQEIWKELESFGTSNEAASQ